MTDFVTLNVVIDYQTGVDGVTAGDLSGFFEGWSSAPTDETLLRILSRSTLTVLARGGDLVVGVINAISDGELAAYIPLLEVRAAYRGRGIGTGLVRQVVDHFRDLYMVDAVCDDEVAPFYERLGMRRLTGMAHRNRNAAVLIA